MSELPEVLQRLQSEWRLDFARVRRVVVSLTEGATVGELVAASGLSRRDVETVVGRLGDVVVAEGDRFRLPASTSPPSSSDAAPTASALEARMAELAAALPASLWRLDHVPATPDTMARRALYLAAEYALDGAAVLCLGDHDLTSLAVGVAAPGAELAVVDIDERILDHVARSAEDLGIPVTAAWADLRLALPPSLAGTADLVFTDPPYTVEGIRLFLVRALEALRPTGHERIAFCFGTGERHLVKALEVQRLLGELRLVLEAMLPGFNRYIGAEAIGARSDLYICRPTKGARVGEAPRSRGRGGSRIYTRGPSALEASERALPETVVSAARAAAGDGPHVLVGAGWDEPAVDLPDFFARVAAWATAARPGPFPFTGVPLVNTDPDYGAAALRTLLLAAPERAVLVVPRRHLDDLTMPILSVAYDIDTVPAGPGGDPAVVTAVRHDRPPGDEAHAVLRHIVLHPGAKVVNAWRDALLALARDAGTPLTKNEARARIAADRLPPGLRLLRPWELPVSAFETLKAAIIPESDEGTGR